MPTKLATEPYQTPQSPGSDHARPAAGQVSTTAEKRTFRAPDLDRFPAVEDLLKRLELGVFVRDTVTAPVGRNDSWAGRTERGRRVMVKRLVGPGADALVRLDRMLSFERLVRDTPLASHTPPLLGFDRDALLVVHEYLDDATSGAGLVVDEVFYEDLAESVGRLIGQLHSTDPGTAGELDRSLPSMPSMALLHGLPLSMFNALSAGEVEAWRLMQQDADLGSALARLREWERVAPRVPSHCDFRVDQLLFAGERIWVTDWEEFRLADPARDVGSFAGEWLYRSVLDIVTARGNGDVALIDTELSHEEILLRGARNMERLVPRFHHFYRGYRAARVEVDEGFAERVTAYAGWHLLDRLVASAARSHRLTGIERAAAGVGRRALLFPARFATVLGLGDPG